MQCAQKIKTPASSPIMQQQTQPRVLSASAANFSRVYDPNEFVQAERPLCLQAWTQTTPEDYELLREVSAKPTKKELELMQKVHTLEENLRSYAQLLSQIHAKTSLKIQTTTAANKQEEIQSVPVQVVPEVQQKRQLQQQQQLEHQSLQRQQKQHIPLQQQQHHIVPKLKIVSPKSANNNSSFINKNSKNSNNNISNHCISSNESVVKTVQYRIIADGNNSESYDDHPIHIQLTTEDDSANLNSSAESDRLEICIAEDNDINNEQSAKSQRSPIDQIKDEEQITPPYVKRRKIVAESSPLPLNNSYQIEQQSNNNNMNNNIAAQPLPIMPCEAFSTPRNSRSLLNLNLAACSSSSSSSNSGSVAGASATAGSSLLQQIDLDNVMVSIGPNNTRVSAKFYESMNWSSPSMATRKLLMAIFDRNTLATHSMTGKPSPAFRGHNKPLKQMLDPKIIQDIVFAVTHKCYVSEKEVRNAITTKCADENKMMKMKNRKSPLCDSNKENFN